MSMPLANLLLALAWAAWVGELTPGTLVIGFVLSYVILGLAQPLIGRSRYFTRVFWLCRFAIFFARELIASNLRVAYRVIRGPASTKPGIVAVPLEARTDMEITALANFITLTPGTLSIEVSENRKTLYVHTLYVDDIDAVRASIKEGLERKLLEALR